MKAELINEPGLARMLADGSAVDVTGPKSVGVPEVKRDGRRRKPVPVLPDCFARKDGTLCFVLGIPTASEANGRDWKARSARTQQARRIVSRTFGKYLLELSYIADWYHTGHPIRVVLSRIGQSKMDKGNVSQSLKATEDAVSLILGCDDGDDRWLVEFAQERCIGKLCGVRIELSRA